MFSPQKDMKDLVIELLKKDQMSISGLSRELASKGVKLHRLELTGYLKALADMGVLRERDIKPAKVFSTSSSRDKGLHELLGEACTSLASNPDDRATLAVYSLQRLFRRPVFDMELRRCGLEGNPEGRKASQEERAEAKAIMSRMGYKVPNSDVPTIVEKDLDSQFAEVLADVIMERFNARSFMRQTTQTKL
jgi:hypothetical protein